MKLFCLLNSDRLGLQNFEFLLFAVFLLVILVLLLVFFSFWFYAVD